MAYCACVEVNVQLVFTTFQLIGTMSIVICNLSVDAKIEALIILGRS